METLIRNIINKETRKQYNYEVLMIGDFLDYRNRMSKNFIKFLDYLKDNLINYKITYVGTDIPGYYKGIDIFTVIKNFSTLENIMIYVCDIRGASLVTQLDKFNGIKIFDFEDIAGKINILVNIINNKRFNYILYKYDTPMTIKIKDSCIKWGNSINEDFPIFIQYDHYIDNQIFKDYYLNKEYDIICYGCTDWGFYPFRKRLFNLLKNSKHFNTLFIEHPGYGYSPKHNLVGNELAKLLNKSKISIVTPSTLDFFVKRYIEAPLSLCCIAGNLPKNNGKELENCIIKLNDKMTDEEIIKKLKYFLNNEEERLELTKKANAICNEYYSYEAGLKKFADIFNFISKNFDNIFNNKIDQIWVSRDLYKFDEPIREKFNLNIYYNINRSAFFFGLYDIEDFKKLSNHKNLAIIIWGGTDSIMINEWDNLKLLRYLPNEIKSNNPAESIIIEEFKKNKRNSPADSAKIFNKIKTLKNIYVEKKNNIPATIFNLLSRPNIRHISISKYIEDDLSQLGIKSHRINLSFVDQNKFYPIEKGDSVYIYTSKNIPELYGKKVYENVIKRMPDINFIICTLNQHKDIMEIYKKCFIGLRLTSHDGNANTVQELGLCGIKCIHNSDYPNAISWSNEDDIIKIIEIERKNIGKIDYELSEKMKEYLKINDNWIYRDFYKKNLYYLLGYESKLELDRGDKINDYNILAEMTKYYNIYYNNEYFDSSKSEKLENLLTKKNIEIPNNSYDIYIVRGNKNIFMKLPNDKIKLWIATPYDEEIFNKADGLIVYTQTWKKYLENPDRQLLTDDETGWNYDRKMIINKPIYIIQQKVNDIFKALQNDKKTLEFRRIFGENSFIIGYFGSINKFTVPNRLINILEKIEDMIRKDIKLIINPKVKQFVTDSNLDKFFICQRFNYYDMPYVISACDCTYDERKMQIAEICGSMHIRESIACNVPVITPNYDSVIEILGEKYELYYNKNFDHNIENQIIDNIIKIIDKKYTLNILPLKSSQSSNFNL